MRAFLRRDLRQHLLREIAVLRRGEYAEWNDGEKRGKEVYAELSDNTKE